MHAILKISLPRLSSLVCCFFAGTLPSVLQAETPAGVTRTVRLDDFLREGYPDWSFSVPEKTRGDVADMQVVKEETGNVLQFHTDFNQRKDPITLSLPLEHLGVADTMAFRFQMRATGLNHYNVQVVDGSGQTHQRKRIGFPADGNWHEVVIRSSDIAGGEHWGGANDGAWHGPASTLNLRFVDYNTVSNRFTAAIRDVTAEVVIPEKSSGNSLSEGFEHPESFAADWTTEGDVQIKREAAYRGEAALRIQQTEADATLMKSPRAVSKPFAVSPGAWQVSGALRSAMYSPDNSYNGIVQVEWLTATGTVLARMQAGLITGDNAWKQFNTRLSAPENARQARLVVAMVKSYGTFDVDDLKVSQLEAASTERWIDRVYLSMEAVGNLLLPEETPQVHLRASAFRSLPADARSVRYVVTDYWGGEMAPARWVTLEADGVENRRMNYQADLDLSGIPLEIGTYYEVRVDVPQGDGEPFREFTSFARLPEAVTRQYAPRDIPFTSRNWDNRFKEYFILTDRLGVRILNIWSDVSATPPYKTSFVGGDWAQDLGMESIGRSVGFKIERHLKGWDAYTPDVLYAATKTFVETYFPRGMTHLSLGNEPHGNYDKVLENVEAYKVMYRAAKDAAPDITVIGTAVGADEDYFKAGFQDHQDVYDFHTYGDYKTIGKIFASYRKFFETYGGEKPIWSTEIGLNSQGQTRQTVAADLIRKVTSFFAYGGENVCWFGFIYPDKEGTMAGSFGQAHNMFYCRYRLFSPKLDAIAYYNMVNGISVKKFKERRVYDDGSMAFLFEDTEGNCLLVLWNDRELAPAGIPLPGVTSAKVTRVDGSTRTFTVQEGALTLDVGTDPMLVEFQRPGMVLPEALQSPVLAFTGELPSIIKGAEARIPLTGPGLSAADVTVEAPPTWQASVEATDGGADLVLLPPEDTGAHEGRLRITRVNGDHTLAEFHVSLPVASRVDIAIRPDLRDGQPGVLVSLMNNGAEAQRADWQIAVTESFPMVKGSYDLTSPQSPDTYFQVDTSGQQQLEGHTAQEKFLPLVDLNPLTIYRFSATIRDEGGLSTTATRLMGGFLGVRRASTPPVLDGSIGDEEWGGTPVAHIDSPEQMNYIKARSDPSKALDGWTGPDDLSAEVRYLWDDDCLYLSAKVRDDQHFATKADGGIWAQDGIQMLIDPARSRKARIGNYDYVFGIGTKGPQAWCNQSAEPAVAPAGEVPDVRIAARKADDGSGNVQYEVAIPWSRVHPFIPQAGGNIGIGMILPEDDGEGRTSIMGWFGGVHLKQADMVGDLILLED